MGGLLSKKFDPNIDLLDLTGKVVIVTGGNAGIGYATVKHLARRGAKVYLAARNESKATGAMASMEAEGLGPGNGEIIWLKLDLSDPREAKKSAEEFLAREKRLDILVNNAAMGGFGEGYDKKSHDGVVDMMMTNHISPFIYTQTLLPLLKQTAKEPGADVRIVNVASRGHTLVSPNVRFRDVADFNITYEKTTWPTFSLYCVTKLANILWTSELQKRIDADGSPIVAISLHPGGVNTFSSKLPFPRLTDWILSLIMKNLDQGAYTSLIAAASADVRENPEKYKGAYLVPYGKLGQPSVTGRNPELAAELWATTERVLEDAGLYSTVT